jgi:SAM-dependent methyltransferase
LAAEEQLDGRGGSPAPDEILRFYYSLRRLHSDVSAEISAKRTEIKERGLLFHVLSDLKWISHRTRLSTVVEVGAGLATNLLLAKEVVEADRYIAVDVAPPEVLHSPGIEYLRGTANDLTKILPRGSVSVVLMLEVIEHLWDPDEAVDQVREVLEAGGFAIISTPNLSSGINRLGLLIGLQPLGTEVSVRRVYGRPGNGQVVGHIRAFTFKSLIELARSANLSVVRAYTVPFGLADRSTRFSKLVSDADRLVTRFNPTLGSRTILVLSKPQVANQSSSEKGSRLP